MLGTGEMLMSSITPFLWFNGQAEQAAKFYVSVFRGKNSKILNSSEMMVTFEILGQEIMALNGGPKFKFNPSFSLFVSCATQKEVDRYWNALSKGGKKGKCGWLQDRYGVSWQIIPSSLGELMSGKDQLGAERVYKAMLKMNKIEIKKLKQAYAGR